MTLNSFKIAVLHVLKQCLLQLGFSGYIAIENAKVQFEILRVVSGL